MAHNKNQNPVLYLPIKYISMKSAPQILSLQDEYTFCYTDFLIIVLCNTSASCHVVKSEERWFEIICPLLAPPGDYLSQDS